MAMARYRKKPVVIEAARWEGPEKPGAVSVDDLQAWGAHVEPTAHWGGACGEEGCDDDYTLLVYVEPEDSMVKCPVGHWIARGVQGEFYPISPEIFEATYEPVPGPGEASTAKK